MHQDPYDTTNMEVEKQKIKQHIIHQQNDNGIS